MTLRPRDARAFFFDARRRAGLGLAVGLGALLLTQVFAGTKSLAISYLAAWLCLLALPAGALPLVIMLERADAWRPQPETALLATLRGLLALMPVAGLLAIPILLKLPDLYPWARGAKPPTTLSAIWFSTPFLAFRLAIAFGAWTALAQLFARRGSDPFGKAGRRDDGRAVLGLGLHGLIGTLVVGDLVLAASENFRPTLSGLVLMASWSCLALAVAILAAPPDIGPARRRLDRLTPFAALLTIWALLHFIQFLVSWSANPPDAAAWYRVRDSGEGRALSLYSGGTVLLAVLSTRSPGENRTRLLAALALVAHVLEFFWFVTPSLRGSFKMTLIDLLSLIGVGGLALALWPQALRFFPETNAAAATDRDASASRS